MSDVATSLFAAIHEGNLSGVQQALADGGPKAARAKLNGMTALEAAIRAKQPAVAHLLIQSGADARQAVGYLCSAISLGDSKLVESLLAAGADPNLDAPGGRPLQFAIKAKSVAIARMLLQAGADPNAGSRLSTPLGDAIKTGQEELALLLVEAGASGEEGASPPPLATAVRLGQSAVVEKLLKRGANPNLRATISEMQCLTRRNIETYEQVEVYTNAPLVHIAAGEGHLKIVRLLLACGADPSEIDDNGLTALQMAQERGQTKVAEALASVGAATMPAKVTSNQALLMAARAGDLPALDRALAAGANLNAQDERRDVLGMTPLMLAAANGHRALVQRLLAAGADPNATDAIPGQKLPPGLGFVYREGGLEAVEAMGVSLGRTALMYAAIGGHVEIIQDLLAGGADAGIRDAVKETALSLAKDEKRAKAVAALEQASGPGKKTSSPKAAAKKAVKEPKAAKKVSKAGERWGESRPAGKKASRTNLAKLKKYDSLAVRERLAQAAQQHGFRQAAEELAKRCGSKPMPLGDGQVLGYTLHVKTGKTIDVRALQEELLARGAFAFAAHDNGERIDRLALLPTVDKYEAIAAMGTDGANYDVTTSDIIRWLMEVEADVPLSITGIESDSIAGTFRQPVKDPEGLAERIYKFCPDVVAQGVGDVAALAETLREPQARLYLWWD